MSEQRIQLSAEDYWRLKAAMQGLTIAELEAKWALAKAETERTDVERALRAKHGLPDDATCRVDERTMTLIVVDHKALKAV